MTPQKQKDELIEKKCPFCSKKTKHKKINGLYFCLNCNPNLRSNK